MNEVVRKIEALLFVAGEAVPKTDLVKLLGVELNELETYLTELHTVLSETGLALILTQDSVHLVTNPTLADFLQQFLDEENTTLSRAAAETLALVAYKGPVSRYDIEAIRGVDSRRVLQQLVRRGLVVKQAGQGRVSLYTVSELFFQHIGVTRREELPQFQVLSSNERIRELLLHNHTSEL